MRDAALKGQQQISARFHFTLRWSIQSDCEKTTMLNVAVFEETSDFNAFKYRTGLKNSIFSQQSEKEGKRVY